MAGLLLPVLLLAGNAMAMTATTARHMLVQRGLGSPLSNLNNCHAMPHLSPDRAAPGRTQAHAVFFRAGSVVLCAAPSPPVVSPFEAGSKAGKSSGPVVGPLALTLENVELVLDEMRPYLMADGGNVAVADIDGGVVRLELQGACGTCPSSTMTMKMGLERGLREKIPEIVEVEQVAPDGPQLTEESIEEVLEEIRPFLKMAGGTVELASLEPAGVMPTCSLRISGSGATINSVRAEIAQRLKRNFPTLASVTWE
uniref:NIF system FeS cluster assembly NifU C-terminal domain-containing protein n=1 Tax=Chrysotila carterae TaxID=13221 RepID=A0A7S4B135_CHRCT|mmetsp:Transcript_27703/g.58300  ORF Transcript_27703/g.58300 Transcript_27703/m.58300 type:complete len:255 (+) Transcript_27703:37-801(+)